jgi:hypothetical protein
MEIRSETDESMNERAVGGPEVHSPLYVLSWK